MIKPKYIVQSEDDAYEAGKDCALNGANTNNCCFTWFRDVFHKNAWQLGYDNNLKKDG